MNTISRGRKWRVINILELRIRVASKYKETLQSMNVNLKFGTRLSFRQKCLAPLTTLFFGCLFSTFSIAQTHYVAVNGVDAVGNGSRTNPWATIGFAIDNVVDGATILVGPGTYRGRVRLDQKFQNGIVIRSEPVYQAKLRHNNGSAVICFTCQGVTLEGFDIAHSADNNRGLVIQIQNSEARNVVNNGTRDILVQGNMFYNQAGSDEHIDINSVQNVKIIDNIFFNSLSQGVTSSFVLIKDSGGASDGIISASDIEVRRNIFFNWQGNDGQSFVRLGEDGNPTFEAQRVLIENNLMLGNSNRLMRSSFTVTGSKDIRFQFNTVVGNNPTRSFAARFTAGGILSENIVMANNIWSDPTGTMGAEGFNGVDVFEAAAGLNSRVTLDNNVYYNGDNPIPPDSSQSVTVADDANAQIGDPKLPSQAGLNLPVFDGSGFNGGFSTIRQVFEDFANRYGKPAADSIALDRASDNNVPVDDLLGRRRGSNPDIGAFERNAEPPVEPPGSPKTILSWLLLLID